MMKYILLSNLILAVFFAKIDGFRLNAQEAGVNSDVNSDVDSKWLDAVKLLDHSSVEDAKRGETLLRQELAQIETPVEAAWALALFCIKRDDWVAADKVLKAIGTRYPNPPMPVLVAVERIKLSVALHLEDATAADIALKKIANATSNTVVSKEDRQLNAASIGAIIGMLEDDVASSPISLEMLDQLQVALRAVKQDDISPQFQFAYQSSRSKAGLLAEKLAKLETVGIDAIQSELQQIAIDREAHSQSVKDAEEALRLAKINADEQTKANRVSIKRLQAYVAKLEQNWKVPTAGHPGPEKPGPVKPQKSSIIVDEFEYKNETVTETDSTGNRVQRTRSVRTRRPQREIDRERDFQYARLMDIYRLQKAEFDEYIVKYRNVLGAWIQADRDRRDKLQDDKRNSLQQASELNKQIDEMEADRIASAKEVTEMRRRLKEIESEEAVLAEVVRTAATQKPEQSFRPGFFETIFVEKEKSRLVKAFQESIR
jgi:hypothetical protein